MKNTLPGQGAREAGAVDNSDAVSVRLAGGRGERAATGSGGFVVRLVSRAEVKRRALQADAVILRNRGLSDHEVGRRLGIAQSTVSRWFQ